MFGFDPEAVRFELPADAEFEGSVRDQRSQCRDGHELCQQDFGAMSMNTVNRFLKSPDNTISVAAMLIGSALIVASVVACASSASAQTMSFGAPRDVSGFAGWVLSKQAIFYRALSGTILAAK